jgi:hypothetical protein
MIQVVCQWPTPVILVTQKAEIRRISVQSQPEQIVPEKNSSQKKKKNHKKRAGGVAQMADCLPSKHEALSSNPSAKGKKKRRKNDSGHGS